VGDRTKTQGGKSLSPNSGENVEASRKKEFYQEAGLSDDEIECSDDDQGDEDDEEQQLCIYTCHSRLR
jgi:hypothetical protein